MTEKLSKYKFKRIVFESFKNGLRLHFDSILLYSNSSFPSAFQLSVLAMEEFAKSNWVEHYYWSSITNDGFPEKEFEQKWLKELYLHSSKQTAFFSLDDIWSYSPKFVEFVKDKKLDQKKQKATYVGLDRIKSKIDVTSRISTPQRIKEKDAKQMVSLLNDYLKEVCSRKLSQEGYFDIYEKDELLTQDLLTKLDKWEFKSGLRGSKWFNEWISKWKKTTANNV